MGTTKFGRGVPPHERHPVAWYHPFVLAGAARELLSSIDQQRNRDVRESFPTPLRLIDRSTTDGGDFWFDFVADTGDGGNATFAVASTVLADLPLVSGGTLPRGELLVFGGDLAYPSASPAEYRFRFVEMFEGARSAAGAREIVRGRQLTVAALAQNHDWMDSATTFGRYFLRGKSKSQFLGADIPQQQSYFCVKLPGGWWLLALDFALDGDIDRDQYEQFESLAAGHGLEAKIDGLRHRMDPDDKVILVYPEPYWTRPIGDGADPSWPWRYQRLEGVIGSRRIKLRLAGDLHHYMRWTSPEDGTLLVCGTGGAFTHPTHTRATTRPIGKKIQNAKDAVPAEPANALWIGHDDEAAIPTFERKAEFPSQAESRRRAWGNITALLNPSPSWKSGNSAFALTLGFFYWFNAYLNSAPFIASFGPDGFAPLGELGLCSASVLWLKAMVYSPFGLLLNIGMVAVCVVLGREARHELPSTANPRTRWVVTAGAGVLHGVLHLVAVFFITFLAQHAGRPLSGYWHGIPSSILAGSLVFVLGSLTGALLFGLYHALMSRWGFLTNNGYSALGIQDFKGFLRMRIDCTTGALTTHFIAIDRVPRRWASNPNPAGMPAWSPRPDDPLEARVQDQFTL